jgi:hypothetical protein
MCRILSPTIIHQLYYWLILKQSVSEENEHQSLIKYTELRRTHREVRLPKIVVHISAFTNSYVAFNIIVAFCSKTARKTCNLVL